MAVSITGPVSGPIGRSIACGISMGGGLSPLAALPDQLPASVTFGTLLGSEDFRALSAVPYRTGGPTDAGLASGTGKYSARTRYFDSEARGGAFTNEVGFNVDPTGGYAWPAGYPANGQFSLSRTNGLTIKAEPRPALLNAHVPNIPANGQPEAGTQYPYITGNLTTRHWLTFAAPVFVEVTAKLPGVTGFRGCLWLLNQVAGNGHEEIDIAEYPGNAPTWMNFALHWNNATQQTTDYANRSVNYGNAFHTYGCEFQPDHVRFYIDGVFFTEIAADSSFATQVMYLLFSLMVDGASGFAVGPPAGSTQYAHIQRWRVWRITQVLNPYGTSIVTSDTRGAGWYEGGSSTSTVGTAVDSLSVPSVVAAGGANQYGRRDYYRDSGALPLVVSGTKYRVRCKFNYGTSGSIQISVYSGGNGTIVAYTGTNAGTVLQLDSGDILSALTAPVTVGSHKEIEFDWTPNSSGYVGPGVGPNSATNGQTVIVYSFELLPPA